MEQAKAGAQALQAANLSFGSVVERDLILADTNKAFLNLATGEYIRVPAEINLANDLERQSSLLKKWILEQLDAQVGVALDKGIPRLELCGIEIQGLTDGRAWDSPELLDEKSLSFLNTKPLMIGNLATVTAGSYPATFPFTSSRQPQVRGILQIAGLTDNPPGVKIRYKLVQNMPAPVSPTENGVIQFKFLRVEVPKDSHRIELYFERDTNYGLGIEVTQTALPGPNGESIPLDFWLKYGGQKKWVGVHQPSVLVWRLPSELSDDEIQAGVKELEQNAKHWTKLNEGSNPEFAHIKSREGWTYILWSHVLREPELRSPTATPLAAPNSSLGPVMEQTLPMDTNGLTDLFDPETGKVIPSPNPPNLAEGLKMLSKAGLFISRDEQKNETVLLGMNAVLAQGSRADQWDKITNQQALDGIRKNHTSQGVMLGASAHGSPPQTFLFKLLNGKIGLLQITGFTDNPRGVKIRYKLVQNEAKFEMPAVTNDFSNGSDILMKMLNQERPAPTNAPILTFEKSSFSLHNGRQLTARIKGTHETAFDTLIEDDDFVVNFASHAVRIEPQRLVLDGAEIAKLSSGTTNYEVQVTNVASTAFLTVTGNGKPIISTNL